MSVAAVRPPCDEAVIRCGEVAPPARGRPPAWTLAAAVLGSSMAFIDGTVVNVALPAVQRDLGTDATGAQWVVEGYALTLSALLLVGGALGDRLGRRRVFGAGVALFALASILCGAAPSAGVLVAARVLQGAAAALLTPGSLALISSAYSGAARGRAIGTWSGATAITAAIGPLLGGLLVEHASWRWAFLINVPIAAVVLTLVVLRVPESRDDSVHGRLDWPGAVLATAGLGLLVLGLIQSQSAGLGDPLVVGAVAGGLVVLGLFLLLERGEESAGTRVPMLSLVLFRSRTFSVTNLLTLLLYAALGGSLFFLPLELIEVRGFSPAQSGAALLPFILILSVLSRFTGSVAARTGPRLPLVSGPLLAALGFVLLAAGAGSSSYVTGVLPGVVTLGLGMAITVAPLTTTVMGSVSTRHAGAASGVNNAVARTAGLIAVAALGLVLTRGFDSSLDRRLGALALPTSARAAIDSQRSRLALIDPPASLDTATRTSVVSEVRGAFDDGFREALLAGGGLALAAALVAAAGLRSGLSPTVEED